MDTTQNLKVRLFISGAEVVPSGNNLGWFLTTTGGGNPGSTSFSVTTVAYCNLSTNVRKHPAYIRGVLLHTLPSDDCDC